MKLLILLLATLSVALGIDVSNTYPFSATLHERYQLYWSFDTQQQTISFAVRVQTTGWVGFGLSPNGGMPGSDVVIGWVESDGRVRFDDRYADAEAPPPIDASQDWELVSGEEENGFTTLEFRRDWVTCDPEDRDIEENTARVIFSWNDNDPASEQLTFANYHGALQRGSVSINLLGGLMNTPQDPEDVASFTIAVSNVTIPNIDTTYWCAGLRLPEEVRSQTRYVTRYSPAITTHIFSYVHHMLIYSCDLDPDDVDTGGHCFTDDVGDSVNECTGGQLIAAWAVGGVGFIYPENVAFPMGGPGGHQFVVVEMHYDNPNVDENVVDSSGIQFFYTSIPREHDAGIIQIGHEVSPLMIIPPNVANYIITGTCSASCTREYLPEGGIHIIGGFLHTHLAGHGLIFRHIRHNDRCNVTEELQPIDSDLQYDFDYQSFTHYKQEIIVEPGDTLQLECFYNTENKGNTTFGGLSTRDEMCLTFSVYYPRAALADCGSRPSFETLLHFLLNPEYVSQEIIAAVWASLQIGDGEAILNTLNHVDWSEENIEALQQILLAGNQTFKCEGESEESEIEGMFPNITCEYQAPDTCTGFTPTPCCQTVSPSQTVTRGGPVTPSQTPSQTPGQTETPTPCCQTVGDGASAIVMSSLLIAALVAASLSIF